MLNPMLCGPVLSRRGCACQQWHLSECTTLAHIVFDLHCDDNKISPVFGWFGVPADVLLGWAQRSDMK